MTKIEIVNGSLKIVDKIYSLEEVEKKMQEQKQEVKHIIKHMPVITSDIVYETTIDNDGTTTQIGKARAYLSTNNMTEKEVEEFAEYINAKAKVTKYIQETYPFQPDWEDEDVLKHCINITQLITGYGWTRKDVDYSIFPYMKTEAQVKEVLSRFKDEIEIVRKYLLTRN